MIVKTITSPSRSAEIMLERDETFSANLFTESGQTHLNLGHQSFDAILKLIEDWIKHETPLDRTNKSL